MSSLVWGQVPSGQVQEPSGQVQEPAGQTQEPAGQTHDPVGQVHKLFLYRHFTICAPKLSASLSLPYLHCFLSSILSSSFSSLSLLLMNTPRNRIYVFTIKYAYMSTFATGIIGRLL